MRFTGGISKGKDVLEDLMDGFVCANKMACTFPVKSAERAYYTGKIHAYEDAIARFRALIEGDGQDDKWYSNGDDVRESGDE